MSTKFSEPIRWYFKIRTVLLGVKFRPLKFYLGPVVNIKIETYEINLKNQKKTLAVWVNFKIVKIGNSCLKKSWIASFLGNC